MAEAVTRKGPPSIASAYSGMSQSSIVIQTPAGTWSERLLVAADCCAGVWGMQGEALGTWHSMLCGLQPSPPA